MPRRCSVGSHDHHNAMASLRRIDQIITITQIEQARGYTSDSTRYIPKYSSWRFEVRWGVVIVVVVRQRIWDDLFHVPL